MGVIDGQAVSASVTNAAFLNKNQSDAMPFDLAIQAGLNFPKSVISTSGAINALDSSKVNVKLTGSSVILNGAVAGTDGDILIVLNATGSNITVNSLSGSASSANQFQLNASTATIATNQSAFFQYETTSAKWYQIGSSASGAGGGSKNYFSLNNANPTLNSGAVTPWSACTLTLSSGVPSGAPTLSATQMTISANNTNPLLISQSAYNLQLVKAAANAQGQGFISGSLTVDREDLAKVLYGSFSYELVSGTVDFSGSSTQSLEIWIYNTVSGAWTQPAGYRGINQSSGQGKVIFSFQTDSTAANATYKIAVITAQTSTSAYVVNFCDFQIGPASIVTGAAMTDWVSYTPTFFNLGTGTTTAVAFYYRRVGDTLFINGRWQMSAAGTGSNIVTVTLPSGLSIDSSKITNNESIGLGAGNRLSGIVRYPLTVSSGASTASNSLLFIDSNLGLLVGASLGLNNQVGFEAQVPIVGWSSNVQMSNDTDTRVVSCVVGLSTTFNIPNITPTKIPFDVVGKDTHGAFNLSTNTYTVPVTGWYSITGAINMTPSIATGEVNPQLYINGSVNSYQSSAKSGTAAVPFGVSYNFLNYLAAGDQIQIYCYQSYGGTTGIRGNNSANNLTNLNINRLSGPSVIAATETVALKRTSTSAAQINSSVATYVDFPNAEIDTHNSWVPSSGAYNPATGTWATQNPVYRVPVSGVYQMSANVGFQSATFALYTSLTLVKNGSGFADGSNAGSSTANQYQTSGSGIVRCNAGDLLGVTIFQDSGANRFLQNYGAPRTQISIVRVGN